MLCCGPLQNAVAALKLGAVAVNPPQQTIEALDRGLVSKRREIFERCLNQLRVLAEIIVFRVRVMFGAEIGMLPPW
jgi:hypothetical protein